MKKKGLKAALFDLDGVVLDTESQYSIFWGGQCRLYHPEHPGLENEIKGSTLDQILDTAWSGPLEKERAEVVRRLNEFEAQMTLNYVAGFEAFVADLRRHGVKTAVVTSSNRMKMENVYSKRPELRGLFDAILTSEDFAESKPSPDCYLRAARHFGLEPRDCVVLEDSINGLRAGRAAGMFVVGLTTTNPRQVVEGLSDVQIPDYQQMDYAALKESVETEMPRVGQYEFLAEPFHCDFAQRLFWGHLGNHMLNAADFHSTERGFGMHRLLGMGRAWVLSRLAIEMEQTPRMYTRFNVATWVENAMRFFTQRNFAVTGVDGTVYGYGRSVWAMIDTATRQPTDIMAVDDGAITQWIERDRSCPIEKGGRVKMGDDAQLAGSVVTHYNDVDINGHINSVKYIEHVLDLWPIDWYRSHSLRRLEIAYVAEAHGGDELTFYREQAGDAFNIRIVKDGGVEVARVAVQFSALSGPTHEAAAR